MNKNQENLVRQFYRDIKTRVDEDFYISIVKRIHTDQEAWDKFESEVRYLSKNEQIMEMINFLFGCYRFPVEFKKEKSNE